MNALPGWFDPDRAITVLPYPVTDRAFLHDVHPADFDRDFLEERYSALPIPVTRNPLVVDLFDAADVAVMGGAKWEWLAEHEDWETWRNEMTTGEFWTHIDPTWPEDA